MEHASSTQHERALLHGKGFIRSAQPTMRPVAELYQTYGKRIFNLAYRMTGDRAAAEDILHEVFIRVIRHADKFRGDSSIYSWIFAIVRNVCLRSRKRSFQAFEKLIKVPERPTEAMLHDEFERRYYVRQVKEGCLTGLLRCLSFHQRVAFILSILYQLPTNMVAAVLKKSENSVRILVSRARANLRAFLCKNCSLYDRANSCRCQNMIHFSLQNRWISGYDPRTSPAAIESELKEYKSEVLLYQSLLEQDPPVQAGAGLLDRQDLMILSRGKVK
jgi:RNA polymerase sigma factor (sigma-70 family)